MRPTGEFRLSTKILSGGRILLISLVWGVGVMVFCLLLQWLVYDDLLHYVGLRLIGGPISGILAFAYARHLLLTERRQRMEMMRRFAIIAEMNDRIRNALQVIECATYASNPSTTGPVRDAVDTIEDVLQKVLVDAHSAGQGRLSSAPEHLPESKKKMSA
jgi:hypothetical protein